MKILFRNIIQNQPTAVFSFNEEQNFKIDTLFTKFNLNKDIIYLVVNGRSLLGQEELKDFNGMIIETRLRLKGGKGGFGSQLKTHQAVKKQTKNFDACRDLQGRRLRIINQEKQINEWRIKKAEEEKLLEKYIKGSNEEEDLFKKIMTEKKQGDIIKKNQKFYDDNQKLKKNIEKSLKYFINKKRRRKKEKDKSSEEIKDDDEESKRNSNNKIKITKKLKIKKMKIDENDVKKEEEKKQIQKEEIEKIKNMDNEEDLLNEILC